MRPSMLEQTAQPKLTPMMEQYRSVKKSLSAETILFFRLGDFYEMFFEDATKASEILNITLTGREGGEAGRIPMCGIPYHSSAEYIRTLLDHNLKVAICEQVGDPKASKGLVERRVTRIITPATYLDDENKGKGFEYMASLVRCDGTYALAYLELGTGEFMVRELTPDRLQGELSILSPREFILPQSLAEDANLISFIKEGLGAGLTVYEDWVFENQEGIRLLVDNFKLGSKSGISFCEQLGLVSASGAILYYLKDHLHSALGHVRLPRVLETKDFMILDRQTQKSLEIVYRQDVRENGMSKLAKNATLLAVLDRTLTHMGSRTLYQWVTHPLLSLPKIKERQEAVGELYSDMPWIEKIRNLLRGIRDMERTLSRLNYGVANARDLVNLKEFLLRVPELQKELCKSKSKALKDILGSLRPFPELSSLIEKAIVDAPPLTVKDGGMIREGFSRELDELFKISRSGKDWILEFQQREIERTGIKSLRVKYSQVFGYAIEISKSNLHLVPSDYIRRQTLANAERFVVQELKDWDQKISGAEDKIKALEYQLFNQVKEVILKELSELQLMAGAVGSLDALLSLALTAIHQRWVCPEVNESTELMIRGGRHPVVEAMLAFGQFVENDTKLDTDKHQLVVLTGPNMAGKSTYIRQVGHIVLLAQMGSFVPAESVKVGIVDRIFTRIGASDDLARGESTFMVEMIETAHILNSATNRSLLILDEVGRGTSTFDGVSIAWAICEHLAQGKTKPRTLFATHYHELTQLEEHFPGIKNYTVLVRENRDGIVFLRKVAAGASDKSYGIHVAKLAGIPKEVTERAEKILKILESENSEATDLIEFGKSRKKTKSVDLGPSLFDVASPEPHPLIEEIKKTDPNSLTPMQALSLIQKWKEKVK